MAFSAITPLRSGRVVVCMLVSLCAAGAAWGAERVHDPRDFGAKGDGKMLCTEAIQKAVDQCTAEGGGTVFLGAGTWLSGTIHMKNHVALELGPGCVLLGSTNVKDYTRPGLINAEGVHHIAIRGQGTVDGNGKAFRWKSGKGPRRPKNLYVKDCTDVLVEGVRMRDAGSWMQHYRFCQRVTLHGVAIFNHISYNNDALDFDSCTDVTISDCNFDSDDDGVTLKSLSDRPCENITITNCVISTHCNAIKMGTESGGGFRNIVVSNCAICSPRYSEKIYGRQRGYAGIALEIVDGGTMQRVAISNIAIRGVTTPIFMRLGNRARPYTKQNPKPGVGTLRDVVISNVVASECSSNGCAIAGIPGHPIENVTLSNITLGFEGGGPKDKAAKEVPEKIESYPESTMFGMLPAYGFYCRHVRGLTLDNIRLRTSEPDPRHAVICDDVENLRLGGLDAQFSPGGFAMLKLTQVRRALITGCQPDVPGGVFLRVEGNATRQIALVGNDLRGAGKSVEAGPKVPKDVIRADAK